MKSEKRIIRIIALLTIGFLLIFCSTNDENNIENIIPSISFSVNISLQAKPELQIIGNAVYFSSYQGVSLGFRSHGIYVIKTGNNQYRAFDASCTYDPETTSHVALKATGYECPTCESQFELFTGSVVKGPAKHMLKAYKTQVGSTSVRVYND